jgi:hypothetical protein
LWTGSSGQDAQGKTYTEYAGLWHQRTVRPVVHLSAFGAWVILSENCPVICRPLNGSVLQEKVKNPF